MLLLAIEAVGMQPAALLLLVLYLAVVAILLPRELAFLRDVEPAQRWRFATMDVLLQVSILLVLVPCAITNELGLTKLTLVAIGFAMLWVAAIWMIVARQRYVQRILKAVREDSEQQLKEINRETKRMEEDESD